MAYVDSSAFVKLVVVEPESRALRRSGNDQHVPIARKLLRPIHMIRVAKPLLD